MTTENPVEIEIKIRIADVQATVSALARAGFNLYHPRAFERNVVWDMAGGPLRQQNKLLRVRETAGVALLTFKQPCGGQTRYKMRTEIETTVADARSLDAILQGLGLQPWFSYEKYRAEYRRQAVAVMVDETPIGSFIEIEGEPDQIDLAAVDLGYSGRDYITLSYHDLFVASGRDGHMVFTP